MNSTGACKYLISTPSYRNNKSKKCERRRHSIDGSMHNNEKICLDFFDFSVTGETKSLDGDEKVEKKKSKKSKETRRRHSIDGSMHQ